MTKKAEKNESNEIKELREKHAAAIAHHKKLDATLGVVTTKIDELEQDMARLGSQVKDAEKEHRLAEKQYLREEITKDELSGIVKKQEADVSAMHDAERKLHIAKQVISEINSEIRTAVNRAGVARQRLCQALRAELISQLPAGLEDQLLKIRATYRDTTWIAVLFDAFPEPHPEKKPHRLNSLRG